MTAIFAASNMGLSGEQGDSGENDAHSVRIITFPLRTVNPGLLGHARVSQVNLLKKGRWVTRSAEKEQIQRCK
jgi:hypothetical protein